MRERGRKEERKINKSLEVFCVRLFPITFNLNLALVLNLGEVEYSGGEDERERRSADAVDDAEELGILEED